MIIDILIAVVVLAALITGAVAGLIKQIGTLVAFVLAVLSCRAFGDRLTAILSGPAPEHPVFMQVVSYILIFVVVFVAVVLLARLLKATARALMLGPVDRILGALFRALLWVVILSACLNVYFLVYPAGEDAFRNPDRPWRTWVAGAGPWIVGMMPNQR